MPLHEHSPDPTWSAVRNPWTVLSLILFSSHSETVSCKNEEIVRLPRSATLHSMNRCNEVNFENGSKNLAAIFSRDALTCSGVSNFRFSAWPTVSKAKPAVLQLVQQVKEYPLLCPYPSQSRHPTGAPSYVRRLPLADHRD